MSDPTPFLVLDTIVALNLTKLVRFNIIKVGVCMRMSILFYLVFLGAQGSGDEVAEMLYLHSSLGLVV